MSKTKFTPGPWTAEYDDKWRHWVVHAHSMPVNSPLVRLSDFDDEAKHDAALIAAAPDLYEALSDLFENEKFHTAIGGNPIMVDRLIQRVWAALKKARGET